MYNFKEIEQEIYDFWKKNKIYEKVKKKNENGKKFYFLQGPPYTSGRLHIGHAWNNSLKDIALRFRRMQGFNVWDRAGYDMHGLPTENKVQKNLGLKDKEQIEKYGVDKFIKECMRFSIEQAELMNTDLLKLGIWMDFENAYMPVKKEFVSGQWAFFKKANDQKRLYKGVKVMHWDSETETSLAKHELEYETVKDSSVYLAFKLKDKDGYLLVWTTTPWTIPYNLAVMVNPDVEYIKVEIDGKFYYLANELVGEIKEVLKKDIKIKEKIKGRKMEGWKYVHPLYSELKEKFDEMKKEWPKVHTIILNKEYVNTKEGTGLVHCAPGCGPEDQEAAEPYGIGTFNTLNEQGILENMGKYSGWKAKEDDKKFLQEFKDKGILLATKVITHEYPHSWRSHKPVVFRTTEQWFLRTQDLSKELLKFNKNVHWIPKKTGESYDKWTENLKDNSITRQRFWGCPIPIWINTKDENDYFLVGSVDELEKLTGKKFDDLSLHRPWIDKIIIKKGGREYKRINDVADVWIDSGTASWNCLYNNAKLIKYYFPADLVLEATEQTRLWFSLLQICSAIMFGKGCYKNVYTHGMILDYQGMKMSKSLGNIISPYEVIDKYGSDILRYYMCEITAGENINFNWEDIKVKQRNLVVLWNLHRYLLDLKKQIESKAGKPGPEEKWIISLKNSTIKNVTALLEDYELDKSITEIEKLFLELSRGYIQMTREKEDKALVYETTKDVFLDVLKMFSLISPFITEKMWISLKEIGLKENSVHLCKWPSYDIKKIDKEIEGEIVIVKKIIEAGLAERDKNKIGLKWPLTKATIYTKDHQSVKKLEEIIKQQLNVKKIELKVNHKGELIVELDTILTPELEAEGFAREISRKVQSMRKNAGLIKKDFIELQLSGDENIIKMLKLQLNFIKKRTNSKSVSFESGGIEKYKNGEKLIVKEKEIVVSFKKLIDKIKK